MKLYSLKIKKLTFHLKKNSGKNNTGKYVINNRGGSRIKHRLRLIDYKRAFFIQAVILNLEYIYKHTATIGLFLYKNGILTYNINSKNIKTGDIINQYVTNNLLNYGSNFFIKNVAIGSIIYNIEINPGIGAQIARAGGTYAQIIGIYSKKKNYIILKLKSKKEYIVHENCMCVLGIADYGYYLKYSKIKNAGKNRTFNKKPHVRGVAMNPIDHPHGGNTSGGRCSISIYNVLSKGFKTKKKINKIRHSFRQFL